MLLRRHWKKLQLWQRCVVNLGVLVAQRHLCPAAYKYALSCPFSAELPLSAAALCFTSASNCKNIDRSSRRKELVSGCLPPGAPLSTVFHRK